VHGVLVHTVLIINVVRPKTAKKPKKTDDGLKADWKRRKVEQPESEDDDMSGMVPSESSVYPQRTRSLSASSGMSVSSGRVSLPPSTSEGDENSEDEAMGGISDNGGEAAERRGLRDVQVKSASSSKASQFLII